MVRYDKSTSEEGRRYLRDRRRSGGTGGASLPIPMGKMAGGGLGIVIALVAAYFGLDLGGAGGGGGGFGLDGSSIGGGNSAAVSDSGPGEVVDLDSEIDQYLAFLMLDIQETWIDYFEQTGQQYAETTLTLFSGSVSTGCGNATSAVGPFYCPAPNDRGVYVDTDFFDELRTRFRAPGDFAQAYVIAHEVGHHIQSITGISDSVRQAKADDPGNANEYSIRQELQADCLAGVWAHSASTRLTRDTGQPIIEEGDIEEGLDAAAAVGDDRIQEQAGVDIDPHTWTHGSAEQRVRWFRVGFDTGDPDRCDTFAASEL